MVGSMFTGMNRGAPTGCAHAAVTATATSCLVGQDARHDSWVFRKPVGTGVGIAGISGRVNPPIHVSRRRVFAERDGVAPRRRLGWSTLRRSTRPSCISAGAVQLCQFLASPEAHERPSGRQFEIAPLIDRQTNLREGGGRQVLALASQLLDQLFEPRIVPDDHHGLGILPHSLAATRGCRPDKPYKDAGPARISPA